MTEKPKGLQWFPKYVGDYARKTKSLSLIEHGAYQVLLDHYYATGDALPSSSSSCRSSSRSSTTDLIPDHTRIYRICGAISKTEQEAVDYVLEQFFYMDESGNYRQKRADEIIAAQAQKHENAVERAKNAVAAREEKKKEKDDRKSKRSSCRSSSRSSKTDQQDNQPEPEPDNNTIVLLPPIIPVDLWLQFLDDQKKNKKPLTDIAQKNAVAKLQRFHDAGHDVAAIIQQSIDNTWRGFFPVKDTISPPSRKNTSNIMEGFENE